MYFVKLLHQHYIFNLICNKDVIINILTSSISRLHIGISLHLVSGFLNDNNY